MERIVTQFGATEAAAGEGDLLASLGIDWTLLIVQLVAFLVLVWLLGKFVYPILIKTLDAREAKIEEAGKAAEAAEKKAEAAESKIEDTLKKARSEAADIVATAKSEATMMIEKAETDARGRSERIVSEAQEEIKKEVIAARTQLEKETVSLVKQAAQLAVLGVADSKLDDALIQKSVKEAKR